MTEPTQDGRTLTPEEAAANAERIRAEGRRFDAEAAKFEAEARKAGAEADEARAKADREIADHIRYGIYNADALGIAQAKNKRFQTYDFHFKVTDSSVNECIDTLNYWHRDKPGCPIEVVFDSPGGEVLSGMRLFDHIRWLGK